MLTIGRSCCSGESSCMCSCLRPTPRWYLSVEAGAPRLDNRVFSAIVEVFGPHIDGSPCHARTETAAASPGGSPVRGRALEGLSHGLGDDHLRGLDHFSFGGDGPRTTGHDDRGGDQDGSGGEEGVGQEGLAGALTGRRAARGAGGAGGNRVLNQQGSSLPCHRGFGLVDEVRGADVHAIEQRDAERGVGRLPQRKAGVGLRQREGGVDRSPNTARIKKSRSVEARRAGRVTCCCCLPT